MTDFSKYGSAIKEEEQDSSLSPDNKSVDFSKYGSPIGTVSVAQKPQDKSEMSAIERFKMSFATKETRNNLAESNKGFVKGGIREMIGDLADVAGGSIPFVTGTLGAAGGAIGGYGVGAVPGAAAGAVAGESIRATIGQLMGVRDDAKPLEEAVAPVTEGLKALVGGKIVQKGGGYILSRFPKLLGIITGESDDAVRAAFSNPKEADMGLAKGDEALREIVNQGKEKSIELREGFFKGYQEAFKKISGVYGNRDVSRTDIFTKFTQLLKDKDVIFSAKGVPDYSTSKIIANPGEVSKINQAIESIQKWQDWSLNGTIRLKQLIGSLTKFPNEQGGASKSPVLGTLYHHLDETIRSTLPKTARKSYDEMNAKFSKQIDTFDDMVDAFNKGDAFSRIANIFSKNRDELREIIKFYETKTGISVQGIVAGRELGMEKNAAFGLINPRSWIDFFVSPTTQGKIITVPGRINSSIIKPAIDKAVDVVQYPGKTLDELMSR